MKNPHRMSMNELLSLPVISARRILENVDTLGGCFRDRDGVLWGTCLVSGAWARYRAVQIAGRDGVSAVMSEFSTLRGFIDFCDGARLEGWAQDQSSPNEAVHLDIMVDGQSIARTRADKFRSDLLAANIGDGHHGFNITLPRPLSRDTSHIVVIQRIADGAFVNMALLEGQETTA